MKSEKVKEIKRVLEEEPFNTIKHHKKEGGWIVLSFQEILTYINKLESENDTLHTNLCEWRKENQQLKDRIENQRMTKKGFRYEILPSTEYSPRRVKDYNEYSTLYNRLAELEDKIENGALIDITKKFIEEEKIKNKTRYLICEHYLTKEVIDFADNKVEAEIKLKELQEN